MLKLIAPPGYEYPCTYSNPVAWVLIGIVFIVYFLYRRFSAGKKQNSGVDVKTTNENLIERLMEAEKLSFVRSHLKIEPKIIMGSMGSGMSDSMPFIVELLKDLYKTNFFDYLQSRNCKDCEIRWIYDEYRKTLSEHDQEADLGCICDMIKKLKEGAKIE